MKQRLHIKRSIVMNKKVVFLFCVDGLTGFRLAIEAAFPNAQIQRCIIHQIRSSTRFLLLSVDLLCVCVKLSASIVMIFFQI